MSKFNHYPDQFDIWFPYNGCRYKDWYDLKLHDGTIHECFSPNGISWSGPNGVKFTDAEVAEVRLIPPERHPLKQMSVQMRVDNAYDSGFYPHMPQYRFDLECFIKDKWQFSRETFGPNYAVARVIAHMRKEIEEVAKKPDDLMEWIDIINLALDGALRTGHKPRDITKALTEKLAILKSRDWPDWRTAGENDPIEHVRGESAVITIKVNYSPKPATTMELTGNIQGVLENLYRRNRIGRAIIYSRNPKEIQIQVKRSEVEVINKALFSLELTPPYYSVEVTDGKITKD